jgi:hypothetical protein
MDNWNKIYMRYGLHSLPNTDELVYILIKDFDINMIYKAKLIKDNFPGITIYDQYYWSIENIGDFSLIEADYWKEI